MKHRPIRTLAAAALCCATVGAQASTVVWDESVNGDLSNDGLSPTALTFGAGSNAVLGTTGTPGSGSSGIDRDYFSFTVQTGFSVTSIRCCRTVSYPVVRHSWHTGWSTAHCHPPPVAEPKICWLLSLRQQHDRHGHPAFSGLWQCASGWHVFGMGAGTGRICRLRLRLPGRAGTPARRGGVTRFRTGGFGRAPAPQNCRTGCRPVFVLTFSGLTIRHPACHMYRFHVYRLAA